MAQSEFLFKNWAEGEGERSGQETNESDIHRWPRSAFFRVLQAGGQTKWVLKKRARRSAKGRHLQLPFRTTYLELQEGQREEAMHVFQTEGGAHRGLRVANLSGIRRSGTEEQANSSFHVFKNTCEAFWRCYRIFISTWLFLNTNWLLDEGMRLRFLPN